MHLLKNEYLQVVINPLGAELTSVKDVTTGVEYIWQGNPRSWNRHAPVLFPIVGRLKDDTYRFDGQSYHMTQHGFARDQLFTITEQSATAVTMTLTSSPETKEQYPFDFRLAIDFVLDQHQLAITYHVSNPQDRELPFSIGGHPGFNVPMIPDQGDFTDYQVTVAPRKAYQRVPLAGPYNDIASADTIDLTHPHPLDHEWFKADAQILTLNQTKTTVMLSTPLNDHGVALTVADAPYLGIWSPYPTSAPFVCLEPWWGIADNVDHDGDFTHKMGLQVLAPVDDFTAQYQISFF